MLSQYSVKSAKTAGVARLLLLVGSVACTALLAGGCSDDDASSNSNQNDNVNVNTNDNDNTNTNTTPPGLHEPCTDQCAEPLVCEDAVCRQTCTGGDGTDCPQDTRCIQEICRPPSTVGGPCDVADGNQDCEAGLVCTAGICEQVTNQQWVISTFDVAEWSNGVVDTTLKTEGSASLRWAHADHTSTCLELSGPTDLSMGEFVSLWVHNDVADVDAGFALVFYSEGGDVYMRVRTDHMGWRRVTVEKALFTVNSSPAGWQGITRICAYATGWSYTPDPSRTLHLDLLHLLQLSPTNPPARFLSTFEAGSLTADVGIEFAQGQNGGTHTVVANPFMDADNPSSYVLHVQIPPTTGSSTRAEYHTQRMPIVGETYIYSWSEYVPADFLTDADVSWLVMGQWKTWPCEEYGTGVYEFGDVICYGGGIFNDREVATNHTDFEHRFRADPHCNEVVDAIATGRWVKYALEVHWTNSATGHYSLYKDGVLLEEQTNVKTLFDGFIPGECDMMWGLGLYSSWSSLGAATLSLYVDDMAVYDIADGVTMQDVLALQ